MAKEWTIKSEAGYEPITDIYEVFGDLEDQGPDAIRKKYEQCKKWCIELMESKEEEDYMDGYKVFTEIVMALNWKIWEHYSETMSPRERILATLYQDLWKDADGYAADNFKGEALTYFYRTTD